MAEDLQVSIERLAYACLRSADEVRAMRAAVLVQTAALAPFMEEHTLRLKAEREERVQFVSARTELWRTLSRPAVAGAIVAALLGGVGVGGVGSDRIVAVLAALAGSAPTAPMVTLPEVPDAP